VRIQSFPSVAVVVSVFAVAMAYLESAVVVYLQLALDARVGEIFPLKPAVGASDLAVIEVGREAVTIVMIAAVGILAGRTGLERLAWSSVVFGAWDIAYYGWLYVFAGWPPSLATTDLLFLIPLPWAGPVWSPIAVSVALVGFGLAAARQLRLGRRLVLRPWHALAGIGGGLLVIVSYTLDGGRLLDGGLPGAYPWPVFAAGMLAAVVAALDVIRRADSDRPVDAAGGPGAAGAEPG
jgi:hypothetical protein